jgi:prepilin signal peptidase PulO-like enzyme (type II secretory pathway)
MTIAAAALTAYLGIVGMLLGSFINLAADRLPRGESLLRPRSHCRACGRQLNLVDLLPVAGYLLRRGRCASCGAPIGVLAPLVEAVSGATMLFPALALGPGRGAVVGFCLTALWGALVVAAGWSRRRRGRDPG